MNLSRWQHKENGKKTMNSVKRDEMNSVRRPVGERERTVLIHKLCKSEWTHEKRVTFEQKFWVKIWSAEQWKINLRWISERFQQITMTSDRNPTCLSIKQVWQQKISLKKVSANSVRANDRTMVTLGGSFERSPFIGCSNRRAAAKPDACRLEILSVERVMQVNSKWEG